MLRVKSRPRGISRDAMKPIAMPKTRPIVTSCATNFHHTKSLWPTRSASLNASTAGRASPSFRPDSRLSEWRTRRGTRGFVTTDEERTGSVGESRAPSRKHSVQERSVSPFAASATRAPVSGMARTSLRKGRRHSRWSISASTSIPSRKRITIRATTARSPTKLPVGSKDRTSAPPSPRAKPASTNRAVSERKERRAIPETSAPPTSARPNTSGDGLELVAADGGEGRKWHVA